MMCVQRFLNSFAAGLVTAVLLVGVPAVAQESEGSTEGTTNSQSSNQDTSNQEDQTRDDQDRSWQDSQDQQRDRSDTDRSESYQQQDRQQDQSSGRATGDQRFDRSYEGQSYDDGRGQQFDRQNQQSREGQRDSQAQRRQWDDQQGGQSGDDAGALGVLLDPRDPIPRVDRVYRDTPADRAGIRSGDEILAIDGQRVDSARQLAQRVRQMNPGDRVEIRIRRNGEQRSVDVRLAQREETFEGRSQGQQRFRDQAGYYDQQGQFGQQRGQYSQQQGQYDRWDQGQSSQIRRELDDLQRELQRLANRVDSLRSRLDGGSFRSSQQMRDYDVDQAGFYDGRTRQFDDQPSGYNQGQQFQSRQGQQGQQFQDRGYESRQYDQARQYSEGYDTRGFQGGQPSWDNSGDPSRALEGASGRDSLRSRTPRVND